MSLATRTVAVLVVASASAFVPFGMVSRAGVCTKTLNTEHIPAHCAGAQLQCGDQSRCCDHEHQLITYQSLVDAGVDTGFKSGLAVKKWFKYKHHVCDDYDNDDQTPTTCGWPFPAVSQDGPSNNPDHFVMNHGLVACGGN